MKHIGTVKWYNSIKGYGFSDNTLENKVNFLKLQEEHPNPVADDKYCWVQTASYHQIQCLVPICLAGERWRIYHLDHDWRHNNWMLTTD